MVSSWLLSRFTRNIKSRKSELNKKEEGGSQSFMLTVPANMTNVPIFHLLTGKEKLQVLVGENENTANLTEVFSL